MLARLRSKAAPRTVTEQQQPRVPIPVSIQPQQASFSKAGPTTTMGIGAPFRWAAGVVARPFRRGERAGSANAATVSAGA